jgi:hypothetical protein
MASGFTPQGWTAVLTSTVVIGVLSACGTDEPKPFVDRPAKDIASASVSATRGAKSVRLAGSLKTDGQNIEIDTIEDSNGDCEGAVSLGEHGMTTFRKVDEKLYLKPNAAYLTPLAGHTTTGKIMTSIGGKWLLVPTKSGSINWCDLDGLLAKVEDEMSDPMPKKGDVLQVGGQEAIEVSQPQDEGQTTLFVKTTEPHYLLKIASQGPTGSAELALTGFDRQVDIMVPTASQVLDPTTYGEVGGFTVDPRVAFGFCKRWPWCQPAQPGDEPLPD